MLRKISLYVFAVLVIGFSISATATGAEDFGAETLYQGRNELGENIYLIRYHEEGFWRVQVIVQHADGWQDVLSKQSFGSLQASEQSLSRLQSLYLPVRWLDSVQAVSTRQLRGGVIWPTTQAWSWQWEQEYAAWLTQEMTVDFYKSHGIATDCADVAYAARWIFARIHGLPAANRLTATNALFTNESLRPEWASLPTAKNWYEDQRFMKALNYLLDSAYTHALMRDSYPVAINADNFLPGIYSLNLRENTGHTQLVHRVNLSGTGIPFLIIQSTVPREVRELNESIYWGSQLPTNGHAGLLRMLWPKYDNGNYSLETPENMPGYSLEQYDPSFIHEKRSFSVELYVRLNPNLDFVELFKKGLQDIKAAFELRKTVVEDGEKNCANQSCPEGSAGYEAWSTPARDLKIAQMMQQSNLLQVIELPKPAADAIAAHYKQELDKTYLVLNQIEYPLNSLAYIWRRDLESADPNVSAGLRWALEPRYFAQVLTQKFADLYKLRQTKIESKTDESLKKIFGNSFSYCHFFSPDQCTELEAEMLKPVTLFGKTLSLRSWFENAFWFNGDPLQTSENQWGGLRLKSKFQVLNDVVKMQVTKRGVGFLQYEDGTVQIGPMGPSGLIPQPLAPGYRWRLLDQESSVGYATAEGKILYHDFVSGQDHEVVAPIGQVEGVLRIDGDTVLVTSKQHLWALKISNAAAQIVYEKEISQLGDHLKKNMLYADPMGQWQVMDMTSGQIHLVPGATAKSRIVFEDALYVGVGTNLQDGLILDKSTGKISVTSDLTKIMFWNTSRTKAVQIGASTMAQDMNLISFDENFKEVSRKFLGYDEGYGENLLLSRPDVLNHSGGKLYHYVGDDLQQVPALADELGYRTQFGSWVLTELPGKKSRLRNLDGSKVLFEGESMILRGGEQNASDYFLLIVPGATEGQRLLAAANFSAPALMTGYFSMFDIQDFATGNLVNYIQSDIDRGLIMNYQNIRFWVEFP